MNIELFDKLYQHSHADSPEFVRIRVGNQFFDYSILGDSESRHEHIRQLVSDINTTCLLVYLYDRGIIASVEIPTQEQNKAGVDVFIPHTAQFKIRLKGRTGIPEMRHKLHDDGTREDGRDYKAIHGGFTSSHLVAVHESIFRVVNIVDSKELLEKSNLMDRDMIENRVRLSSMNTSWRSTLEDICGAEAWWKRVYGRESYSKINYYFPPKLFGSLSEHQISSSDGVLLEGFYRDAWNHVVEKYIK